MGVAHAMHIVALDMHVHVCGALVQFGCYQHKHKRLSSIPIYMYIRLSLEVNMYMYMYMCTCISICRCMYRVCVRICCLMTTGGILAYQSVGILEQWWN